MNSQIKSTISHALTSFGESLKCPEQYRVDGAHLAQHVFLTLQAKSKYSISGVRFAGSFGKKTDVLSPDLDLTVVVNNELPPFDKILDDFQVILTANHKQLNIHPNFERSRRAIQFQFMNGIEVDLLPAANLSIPEVHAEIRKNPANYELYSSSTVQKQISFLTTQNGFTHTLIRLAKHWLKSLPLEKTLKAGSVIMEMIGVYVATLEEAESNKRLDTRSMLRAFTLLIDKVCNLGSLKLAFREVKDDTWEQVPFNELQDYGRRRDLIPNVVGTEDILRRNCFIIAPGNPFNDYLFSNRELFGKLQGFAATTRKRLENITRSNIQQGDPIAILFERMPRH